MSKQRTGTSASKSRFGSGQHVRAAGGLRPSGEERVIKMIEDDNMNKYCEKSASVQEACLCHPLNRQSIESDVA